jgi:hypothetical protein
MSSEFLSSCTTATTTTPRTELQQVLEKHTRLSIQATTTPQKSACLGLLLVAKATNTYLHEQPATRLLHGTFVAAIHQ